MKLNDVELIKSTFARIESEQHAFAGRFYANLFQSCPEVEQLFKSVGMEMQGKMVIQAIGIAVNSMDHPDDFSTIFRSLGRRHLLYGVKADFYPFLSEAFIETCKSTFGSLIDDCAEQDWRQLLEAIGEEMSNGANKTVSDFPSEPSFRRRNENLDDPYLARFLKNRKPSESSNELLDPQAINKKVQLNYLGEKSVEISPMQTILEASHANGIPHICECGGSARCSTCRVMIIDGVENCLPRTTLEQRMATRKGFYPEIRLACQTRVVGDVTLKRLVRDENDIDMALSGTIGEAGEEIEGAVLFTDIWGFTTFSENNLPYDVIHALNLLFRSLGEAVDDNDGYVDKYIGDNVMAIFGLGGESPEHTCRNAVTAAAQMLASLPRINNYLRNYLGDEFRLGIGIAFGPMVTCEIGFSLKKQFTAIGDTVNVAARLESSTRTHQADLLVSDSVVSNLVKDSYELKRSFELELKGKTEKVFAHEIALVS
jgi:class 3 adenylate cyclase/hemoglobin-like flavoprotein